MLQQQQLLPYLHPAATYQQLHARILQPKQTRAEVSTARNVLNKLLVQAIDGAFFQSLEDSLIGTQFCFKVNSDAIKLFIFFIDDYTANI